MKKQYSKSLWLMLVMLCISIGASGYSFEVDGIYYNILSSSDKTCEVTYKTDSYNSYSGSIEIPSSVTYNSVEYKVSSIGYLAFYGCSGLTEVNIPSSVTNIGNYAFSGCSGLTEVTIPSYVTSIGESAFWGCSGLTEVTIPSSVTNIGNYAFSGCSGLTEVTIPSYVTSIGESAFYDCKKIKTITWNCNLNEFPFSFSISSIKELYIGDDITIVYSNFNVCTNLQKVVLGKNVAYIRDNAFSSANIKEFKVTSEEPPYCYPNVFGTNDLSSATLYVPESKVEYYQTTEPWTKFGQVLTLNGDEPVGPVQCATPTITYTGEKITFGCTTEGASVHYTISPTGNKSGVIAPGDVEISGLYNVTPYAFLRIDTQL